MCVPRAQRRGPAGHVWNTTLPQSFLSGCVTAAVDDFEDGECSSVCREDKHLFRFWTFSSQLVLGSKTVDLS